MKPIRMIPVGDGISIINIYESGDVEFELCEEGDGDHGKMMSLWLSKQACHQLLTALENDPDGTQLAYYAELFFGVMAGFYLTIEKIQAEEMRGDMVAAGARMSALRTALFSVLRG